MNAAPKWNIQEVTVRQGYWFYFFDGERRITAFASGFSCKEIVFNGDDLVSAHRSIKRKSLHTFSIGQDNYELEFFVVDLLTGEMICTLRKNGKLLAQEVKAYWSVASAKKNLLSSAIIGGIMGAFIGSLIGTSLWK